LHPSQTSTRSLPRVFFVPLTLLLVLFIASPSLASAAPGVTWSRLDQQVGQYAPRSNLLVAEITGEACQSIHALNADEQLAIASTFKIYVLGEVARQVQAGTLEWDTPITITDRLRSMPSGDYAWMPEGRQASVEELATAMMASSDNTATDHLIDRLGRDNVEAAFAAYGHADPEVNAPLLMTRELFAIKMWQSSEWMASYATATDEEQLEILTNEIDRIRINPSGGWGHWNGPTAIDGIEWFASADDLCRAMTTLWSLGAEPGMEPVREILTRNRGGVADAAVWPQAGLKTGYEAGVVNATWVLERHDGRVFFISVGFNHPQWVVDQGAPYALLGPVFTCLSAYQQPGDCDI
jgi:hypothetical protein